MKSGKDIVPWKCSECGVEFETPDGGVCKSCGLVLCRKHLRKHQIKHLINQPENGLNLKMA